MAKKIDIKHIEHTLKELLQNKGIDIHKIVVFGSFAKNTQKKDSDIDIIVVSKDFRDKDIFARVRITRGIHRQLVEKIVKPFDIIYYSDREWEKGNSVIINAAKEEGVVIHG